MSDVDAAASGERRARRALRKAAQHEAKARELRRFADAVQKGNEGTRRTTALIDVLDGVGWFVLHDRYASDGGLAHAAHVVVGPPGVLVIDSKNWSGHVTLDETGMAINGYRRDSSLHSAHALTAGVSAAAGMVAAPVLCFTQDVGLPAPVHHQGVTALQAEQLLLWMRSLPRVLDPGAVRRIHASLEAALPARVGPRRAVRARGRAVARRRATPRIGAVSMARAFVVRAATTLLFAGLVLGASQYLLVGLQRSVHDVGPRPSPTATVVRR